MIGRMIAPTARDDVARPGEGFRKLRFQMIADMRETISAIAADPAKGSLSFTVLTSWAGQTRSESHAKPIRLGGQSYDRLLLPTRK